LDGYESIPKGNWKNLKKLLIYNNSSYQKKNIDEPIHLFSLICIETKAKKEFFMKIYIEN
jgi:hypothetical protein